MKKRLISIAALLLTLCMILGACGTAPAPTPAPPAAEPAPAPAPETSIVNATGMPIVNQPVTLEVTTMRWGAMGDTFTQNTWLQDLEARSGLTISWNAVSNEGWPEARNLLLLSDDLPDVFIGDATIEDGNVMANMNKFMDLTPLIESHMPKYKNAIATVPAFQKITTYPDGKIYSFAQNLPARPMTRNQLVINKDWLAAAGLSAPTTIDEFTDMLRAFKEQDVNGNGDPNDEIGYTFAGDVQLDFYSMFGLTDINASAMFMNNGTPEYIYTSDRYKEAIKWVHEVYAEGLIDQTGFTMDGAARDAKVRNEAVALVGVNYEWSQEAITGQWADQYDVYPPLKGPDGNQYAEGDPDGVYSLKRNSAHITTSCEYPEAAARWLDEFYDSEASIQNFWGAIGTVITKNSDGTYAINNPPEGTSADEWYWNSSLRDFGPKYVEPGFSDKIIFDRSTGDGRKLEDSKLADPFIMEQYPLVVFTPEESERLSITGTEIGTYVSQMRAEWIVNGGIEEGWDAYVTQLKNIGLDEFVQIKVDAYERFAN